MKKQKNKDMGCAGALIYMSIAICGIVLIISFIGGAAAFIAVVFAIIFILKMLYKLFKILYAIIKKKLNEKEFKDKEKTENDSMIYNYFDGAGKEYDPYLLDAGQTVVDEERASIGMIQRKLKIGFNRAYRIMEQLEECNVVGEEHGAAPRKVLMTIDEFQIFKSQFKGLLTYDYENYENKYSNNFYNQMSERIEMYNNKFDYMDGHDFEYFCADILKKNDFKNVEVTQGSGDHGIDILAEKDSITYAIQCKCYSSNIGNAAVQQAHTGKSIYRKDIAVVLTNRYFTTQAKEEAQVLGVKLWNRDKLNEMIKNS